MSNSTSSALAWRDARVLWRWEQKANLRLLREQLLSSPRGRLFALAGVVSIVPLWQILANGIAGRLPLTAPAQDGVLVVAHLFAMASCVLGTLGYYVAILYRRFDREPLRAHAGFTPLLRMYRTVVGVVVTVVFVTAVSLGVMFGDIFWSRSHGGLRLAAYGVSAVLFFSALSLGVLRVATWLSDRRRLPSGLGSLRLLAIVNMLAYFGMVFVPLRLAARYPAWLEDLGTTAQHIGFALQWPLVIALPRDGADPAVLTPLSLAVAAALWLGWRALRRWATGHDAVDDVTPGSDRHYATVFGSRAARPRRLFWIKDIELIYRRAPAVYFQEQWLLLGSAAVVLVTATSIAGTTPPGLLAFGVASVMLMCAAMLAALRGLGSLGIEGSQVRLLRPAVAPRELLRLKGAACAAFAAAHGVVYGWLLMSLASALGLLPGAGGWHLFAAGLLSGGAAAAFAILATGVGFVLPAFDSGKTLLPGASRAGLILYLGAAGIAVPFMALPWILWVRDRSTLAVLTGVESVSLLAVASAGVLLGIWGAARLEEREW